MWYSAFLGGWPTIATRQLLILFFAWFDFLTSISTHLVQRIWILGCYYQSWKIHQFNNNRLTVRRKGIAWSKIFLVVIKFSHYRRVRCENLERQDATQQQQGARLSVRKVKPSTLPLFSIPGKLLCIFIGNRATATSHSVLNKLGVILESGLLRQFWLLCQSENSVLNRILVYNAGNAWSFNAKCTLVPMHNGCSAQWAEASECENRAWSALKCRQRHLHRTLLAHNFSFSLAKLITPLPQPTIDLFRDFTYA